ncbi:MAG: hypothetical protein WCR52_15150 [Bacteroidota bacterium]
MCKSVIAAALLSLVFLMSLGAQNLPSKWQFGVKAGFRMQMLPNGGGQGGDNYLIQREGMHGGIFATRQLNTKWSLRGEIEYGRSVNRNGEEFSRLTYVLAPRYKLNSWLTLEAGLEARQPGLTTSWVIAGPRPMERANANVFAGVALKLGTGELNLRYSPGYQANSPSSRGGWTHGFQIGISAPLFQSKQKIH